MKTHESRARSSFLPGAGILVGTAWILFCAQAATARTIVLTRPAIPTEHVLISNVAGSVIIHGWKQNAVHVSGTLGAGSVRVAVHSRDGHIWIRVILPEYVRHVRGTDLVVDVPVASHLVVRTVSANIRASGLIGSSRLKSVSGKVVLRSGSRLITVKSVSGTVSITGSAPLARILARTVSGSLLIREVSGRVRATSVSGSIHVLDHLRVIRALLHTTSGDIRFQGPLLHAGRYVLDSVSGDIHMRTAIHPSARFSISSFSGSITNNFGPRPPRRSEYGPGRVLDFVSGSHAAFVKIHSLSGNISLRAR